MKTLKALPVSRLSSDINDKVTRMTCLIDLIKSFSMCKAAADTVLQIERELNVIQLSNSKIGSMADEVVTEALDLMEKLHAEAKVERDAAAGLAAQIYGNC